MTVESWLVVENWTSSWPNWSRKWGRKKSQWKNTQWKMYLLLRQKIKKSSKSQDWNDLEFYETQSVSQFKGTNKTFPVTDMDIITMSKVHLYFHISLTLEKVYWTVVGFISIIFITFAQMVFQVFSVIEMQQCSSIWIWPCRPCALIYVISIWVTAVSTGLA